MYGQCGIVEGGERLRRESASQRKKTWAWECRCGLKTGIVLWGENVCNIKIDQTHTPHYDDNQVNCIMWPRFSKKSWNAPVRNNLRGRHITIAAAHQHRLDEAILNIRLHCPTYKMKMSTFPGLLQARFRVVQWTFGIGTAPSWAFLRWRWRWTRFHCSNTVWEFAWVEIKVKFARSWWNPRPEASRRI